MSTAINVDRRACLAPWLFTKDPDEMMMSRRPVETAHWPFPISDGIIWVAKAVRPSVARNVRELLISIAELTGFSSRDTAELLGTSHTTVQKIRRGRQIDGSRSPGLEERIADAHAVIARLSELVSGDRSRLVAALRETDPESRAAASDLLAKGQAADAYLLALDATRDRERGLLLVGQRPASPAGATVSLVD